MGGNKNIGWVMVQLGEAMLESQLSMGGRDGPVYRAFYEAFNSIKETSKFVEFRDVPEGAATFVEAAKTYFKGKRPANEATESELMDRNSAFIESCWSRLGITVSLEIAELVRLKLHASPDACSERIIDFILSMMDRLPLWIQNGTLPPSRAPGKAAENHKKPADAPAPPDHPAPETRAMPESPTSRPTPPPKLLERVRRTENPAILIELETSCDPGKVRKALDESVRLMPDVSGKHDREMLYAAQIGTNGLYAVSRLWTNAFFTTDSKEASSGGNPTGKGGVPFAMPDESGLGIRIKGLWKAFDGHLSLLFALEGQDGEPFAEFDKDYFIIDPSEWTRVPKGGSTAGFGEAHRQGGAANVPPRKLPLYILIDTSGSMRGEPINAVKAGLNSLLAALRNDPAASETALVSVITFDRDAKMLMPMTEAACASLPEIPELQSSPTNLGEALQLMCSRYDAEALKYGNATGSEWLPAAVVMTDGAPSDTLLFNSMCKEVKRRRFSRIIGCAAGPKAKREPLELFCTEVRTIETMDSGSFSRFWLWVSRAFTGGVDDIVDLVEELPPPPPDLGGVEDIIDLVEELPPPPPDLKLTFF
ncbi:MAG: VWA domain-containing protein [Deltaproteobacteria bacterium]|jgi:uncharacterized protein YegL|nr:VWA domain-containing protein [Deltaproteobacteria bacterium]